MNSILTVVGNRPQFIKMAPVSREIIARGYNEFIVHTGQHFDENMSDVFFEELDIPEPSINLNISSGSHGEMTARMLIELEALFMREKPKAVLIYGDTNSTLAAALAAVKLHIPLAHVEAGPRIYDIDTPEEINRIVADHSSSLRFCPDIVSVQNLAKENITQGVHFTGDVMYDAFVMFSRRAAERSAILKELNIINKEFALMTVHRPKNTDSEAALHRIIEVLKYSPIMTILPIHPRTLSAFKNFNLLDSLKELTNVRVIPALGYLDTLQLLNHCKIVLTDSGGLQKEAFFAQKPAIVLFHITPWPQIESLGCLKCCWGTEGINVQQTLEAITTMLPPENPPEFFGNGKAAIKIVDLLQQKEWLS